MCGSGWRSVSTIMDSGSAEMCVAPDDIAKSIPSVETEASRQGQTYHTSDAGVIKNNVGKDSDDVFRDGVTSIARGYQKTDSTRPFNSVSRVCDQGNNVLFTQTRGWIINHETCRKTWFPREHNESPADKRVRRSDEPFLWHEREESAIPRDTWNQRSL